jgi:hypothetical protein
VKILRHARDKWKVFAVSLAIAALPATALAAADGAPVPGQRLAELAQNQFGGTVDVQKGAIDGQVSLDSLSASVHAALSDPGIDGQLQVTVPGQFAGTIGTANEALSYNLAACGANVMLGLRGTSLSDAHFSFQDIASNPAACTSPPSTSQRQLLMRPLMVAAAAQVQPSGPQTDTLVFLENWVRRLFAFSLLGAVLMLIVPSMAGALNVATHTSPWGRVGVGLALALTLPILGVLLFAIGLSLGLWWLGALVLALYPVLLILSMSVSGLVLGAWLNGRIQRPGVPSVLAFGLGMLIISFASLLPLVGPLVNIAAVIFGLGTLMLAPRSLSPAAPAASGGMGPAQGPSEPAVTSAPLVAA